MTKLPSTKDYVRQDFERMHKELTDDDAIDENKRRTEREQRMRDKQLDTGL